MKSDAGTCDKFGGQWSMAKDPNRCGLVNKQSAKVRRRQAANSFASIWDQADP